LEGCGFEPWHLPAMFVPGLPHLEKLLNHSVAFSDKNVASHILRILKKVHFKFRSFTTYARMSFSIDLPDFSIMSFFKLFQL